MTPHLLGVAEIAAMLGLTRQRVNQIVQSDDFPPPEAELSAGRIWTREVVERWVAAHPDRATEVGSAMFGSFTPTARGVIVRAQEEARSLRHDYIGTEHLLLAVLSDAAADTSHRLAALGVTHDDVVADLAVRCPSGITAPTGHIPFTPRSKDILTRAAALAGPSGGSVEARHIAQAIVRVFDGVAAALMRERAGLDHDGLCAEIDRIFGDDALFTSAPAADGSLRCSFCAKGAGQVQQLVAGPGIYICDECIDLCRRIIDAERTPDGAPDGGSDPDSGSDPDPGSDPERRALTARLDRLAAELDELRHDLRPGT